MIATMQKHDTIIDEIRAYREKIAQDCDFDMQKIGQYIRKQEKRPLSEFQPTITPKLNSDLNAIFNYNMSEMTIN